MLTLAARWREHKSKNKPDKDSCVMSHQYRYNVPSVSNGIMTTRWSGNENGVEYSQLKVKGNKKIGTYMYRGN